MGTCYFRIGMMQKFIQSFTDCRMTGSNDYIFLLNVQVVNSCPTGSF